jgi:hypothetical protein
MIWPFSTRNAGFRKMAQALAILIAVPVLHGCNNDDSVVDPGSIVPPMNLTVGNIWHFQSRLNEPGAPVVEVSRSIVELKQISYLGREISVANELVVSKSAKPTFQGIAAC